MPYGVTQIYIPPSLPKNTMFQFWDDKEIELIVNTKGFKCESIHSGTTDSVVLKINIVSQRINKNNKKNIIIIFWATLHARKLLT